MAERYYQQIGDSYCMNCGHPKEDYRQHRDNKPPHCPTVEPVAERLPVIYAHFTSHGNLVPGYTSLTKPRETQGTTIVEYIPRAQGNEATVLSSDESARYQDIIGIAYAYDHGLIDSVNAMREIVELCSGTAETRKARGE